MRCVTAWTRPSTHVVLGLIFIRYTAKQGVDDVGFFQAIQAVRDWAGVQ
jgi:hypothetical protein